MLRAYLLGPLNKASRILRGDAKQTVDEKIKLSKTFGSNWRLKCRELMS